MKRALPFVLVAVGCAFLTTCHRGGGGLARQDDVWRRTLDALGSAVISPLVAFQTEPTPMGVGDRFERVLGLNGKHVYTVNCEAGQALTGSAGQEGIDIVVEIYSPSGKLLDRVDGPTRGPEPFTILASTGGRYRIEIRPFLADSPEGKYTLHLDSAMSFEDVADKNAKDTFGDGALYHLAKRLRSRTGPALDDFMAERVGKGPLVEPDAAHPSDAFVTFLYRGDAETEAVNVLNVPNLLSPGHKPMSRLEDSELWYLRMSLPRDARFRYAFEVRSVVSKPPVALRRLAQLDDPLVKPLGPYGSVLSLDLAPRQEWAEEHAGTPRGKVERASIDSAILKEKRGFGVYTPAGYDPRGKANRSMYVFDGEAYGSSGPALVPTATVLDNLIAAGRIPPTIAVLVDNQGVRDRDLVNYRPFADFLAKELVPWVRAHYAVSKNPTDTIVAGSSFGGLCSAFVAFSHPAVFGNVLSQSGAFVASSGWQRQFELGYMNDGGELVARYAASRRLPLRFYMDAGRFEPSTILQPTRHLRDVLRLKGYPVTYVEYNGAHDYVYWRNSIGDGLIALIGTKKR